jgi:hypothetical protein
VATRKEEDEYDKKFKAQQEKVAQEAFAKEQRKKRLQALKDEIQNRRGLHD